MHELENDNIDFEIVLRDGDFDIKDRYDFLINMFASDFGIDKPDKIYYLRRICRFRNPKFPRNADKFKIVEELSKFRK